MPTVLKKVSVGGPLLQDGGPTVGEKEQAPSQPGGSVPDISMRPEGSARCEQASQGLNKTDDDARATLASITDLVFRFDSEGRFLAFYGNSAGDLLAPPEEFLGRHHNDVMPPEMHAPFAAAFLRNSEDRQTAEYEYSLPVRGEQRWYSVKLSPVIMGDEFRGSVAVVRDITAKKQTESALRVSEARQNALLSATTDFICLLDREGVFLALNEPAARSLGANVEVLAGTCVFDWFSKADAESRRARFDEVVRTGRAVQFEDRRGDRSFESHFWPIHSRDGTVEAVAAYAREITDRKRAEEDRDGYQARLRQLIVELSLARERERSQLADVLHDSVLQLLATAALKLDSLQVATSDGDVAARLDEIGDHLSEAGRIARSLTANLCPRVLYRQGLGPAIEHLVRHFSDEHGLDVRLMDDGEPRLLDEAVLGILYTSIGNSCATS